MKLSQIITSAKRRSAAYFYKLNYHSKNNINIRKKHQETNLAISNQFAVHNKTHQSSFLYSSFLHSPQKVLVDKFSKQSNNPLHPCIASLSAYNLYLETSQKSWLSVFNQNKSTMHSKLVTDEDHAYFLYPQPYPKYGLQKNWSSGICQALACSVYIRSYILNGDPHAIRNAKRCLRFALDELNNLKIDGPEMGAWIEEYPSTPPSFVLNGYIFFIIALLEMEQISNEDWGANSFLQSLIKQLYLFQYNERLLYDLRFKLFANDHYCLIHKFQMKHLEELTGFGGFSGLVNC